MSELVSPVDAEKTELLKAVEAYRNGRKSGLNLFELIQATKKELPHLRNKKDLTEKEKEEIRLYIQEAGATENEAKMVQNHWTREKKFFE